MGAENMIEIIAMRSPECFNWGAEDRLETVIFLSQECFKKGIIRQGGYGYMEESLVH